MIKLIVSLLFLAVISGCSLFSGDRKEAVQVDRTAELDFPPNIIDEDQAK